MEQYEMGYLIEKLIQEKKLTRQKGWLITAILDIIFILLVLYVAIIAKSDFELQQKIYSECLKINYTNDSIIKNIFPNTTIK